MGASGAGRTSFTEASSLQTDPGGASQTLPPGHEEQAEVAAADSAITIEVTRAGGTVAPAEEHHPQVTAAHSSISIEITWAVLIELDLERAHADGAVETTDPDEVLASRRDTELENGVMGLAIDIREGIAIAGDHLQRLAVADVDREIRVEAIRIACGEPEHPRPWQRESIPDIRPDTSEELAGTQTRIKPHVRVGRISGVEGHAPSGENLPGLDAVGHTRRHSQTDRQQPRGCVISIGPDESHTARRPNLSHDVVLRSFTWRRRSPRSTAGRALPAGRSRHLRRRIMLGIAMQAP